MASQRSLEILVVDPRGEITPLITRALAGLPASLEVTTDPATGLQLARTRHGRFDLAVVDCLKSSSVLPDCLGVIRALGVEFPRIPVVGVAADDTGTGEIIEAFRLGARDFLKRPFDTADLVATLARVVRYRRWLPAAAPVPADAMRRIIPFLEQHYMHRVSLDTLARLAGISRWHVCRLFRAVTGRSFRTFVTELRLARARELLLGSDLSVTDIAHEVGFYDLSHLDRAFRRRFGIRPGDLLVERPSTRGPRILARHRRRVG
jgi:AraC-like DNA-binding protein